MDSSVAQKHRFGAGALLLAFLLLLTIRPVACDDDDDDEETEIVKPDYNAEFGPNFKGCFTDEEKNPDLTKGRTSMFQLTQEMCRAYCKPKDAKYMGLQNGEICSCGDNFGRFGMGHPSDCMNVCPGAAADSKEYCGGLNYNAIFTLS